MSNINLETRKQIEEAVKRIKNNTSKAGERVKAKRSILIRQKNEYQLKFNLIGESGKNYETINLAFKDTVTPYYDAECFKLACMLNWSGSFLSERDEKRLIFITKYGDKNKITLNKSLRNINMICNIHHYANRIFKIKKT